MTLTLRPYQIQTFADLRAAFARGYRSVLCVSPTGSGKTVLAAFIILSALAKGNRILFLAGRTELINQTVAVLVLAGILDVRIIQAERDDGPPDARVTVASIQTLTTSRWNGRRPPADLVVLDECAHGPARTWASVMIGYRSARWLGLTATPVRADGRALGDLFEVIVLGPSVRELTELGALVRCRVLAPPSELEPSQLAMDPVEAYQRHGNGERAGVFCTSVNQAREYAAVFEAQGITSSVISAKTPRRGEILQRFAAGEIRALCSVGVLTEGWDDPGCSVAILARKPTNVGLWLQICGRVLRPSPGKLLATVVDLQGAVHEHGTPDLDRTYSLTGRAISSVIKDSLSRCITCGSCFLVGPAQCPFCGAELPRRPLQLPRSTGVGVSDVGSVQQRREFVVAMVSKRAGWCESCRGPIAAGDEILWATAARTARHRYCRGERVSA